MVPDTWAAFRRALLRWDPSKIHPLVAIRNTAVVVLALAIAQALKVPSWGLIASLGALNVAYSDGIDPYPIRARRMVLSSFICAVAVLLGTLSARNHLVAILLAGAWAFGAGLVTVLGQTASDLGTVSTVTLVVFGARPLSPRDAAVAGLVALIGGLAQTTVAL